MTNSFHATPYDVSAKGFYFSTYEQWVERAAKHRNDYGEPVEEYEIQFIDGDSYELFNAIGVNQANLERWFTEFEELEGEDRIKIIYLLDHAGYNLENALDNIDDVSLFEGRVTKMDNWSLVHISNIDSTVPFVFIIFPMFALRVLRVLFMGLSSWELLSTKRRFGMPWSDGVLKSGKSGNSSSKVSSNRVYRVEARVNYF